MNNTSTRSKLLKYTSAAAAVTGATVANGQIFYTDFNPDINIQGNLSTTRIDVDNDGMDDFEFVLIDSLVSGVVPWGKLIVNGLGAGNDVVGYVTSGYSYVSLLQNSSTTIGASAPFISGGIMAEYPTFGASYPLWNNGVTDGYLGFRINVNGQTHHGWMRLDVAADSKSAVLKDMAFNGTAGDPIFTGQSVGIEEDLKRHVHVHQSGEEMIINFPGHLLNTEIQVTDLTGRIVAQTRAENTKVHIDWSAHSAGIYIVRLSNNGFVVAQKHLMR